MVREQSLKCWLTVRSKAFPEIGEGAFVQVECLTDDIRAERPSVPLQPVEAQEGALRATWSVKALTETSATGLEARVGPIKAESTIAVLASEAERYRDVTELQFERKSYRIRGGSRRSIRLLAPTDAGSLRRSRVRSRAVLGRFPHLRGKEVGAERHPRGSRLQAHRGGAGR